MKSPERDDESPRWPCDVPHQEDLLAADLPLFPMPGPLLRLSARGVLPFAPEHWLACDPLHRGLARRRFLRSLPCPPIKGGWIFGSSILNSPHTTTHPLHPRNGPAKRSQPLQPLRNPPLHRQQRSQASPASRSALHIPAPDPIIRQPVHRGHPCSHAVPAAAIVHLQHRPFSGAYATHPSRELSAAV